MNESLSRHEVAQWVREQRTASPVAKLILQLVFEHAGPQEDGRWVAWAGSKTLAWEACLADGANGARTVRRHLADLEEAGIIEREERRRSNGSQTTNRVVLLIPADWRARGPRTDESGGAGPASPPQKPQEEAPAGSPTESGDAQAGATDPRLSVPDDFPDELRPHARHVMRVLRSVAEQHGAKEVTALALGRVIMARPRKPLVKSAHDFAAWAADPPRPIRDVVASYRTWLDRSPTLATTERLDGDGLPSDDVAGPPSGVTPIRGGRGQSNADRVDEQIRRLRGEA